MKLNKNWFVALAIVVVIGLYAFLFRDWFHQPPLTIYHRIAVGRSFWPDPRPGAAQAPNTPMVTFGFDRKLKLTDVKVFLLPELETNKNAQPIWHLISDSNSIPVKGFSYGARIRGMKPFVKGSPPLPLSTDASYRLLIAAGSVRGEHDFNLGEKPLDGVSK